MASKIKNFNPEYSKPVLSADQQELRDFYSSSRWQSLRTWYKHRSPVCERCMMIPVDVHHVKEVATHWDLRFDSNNLMSLCKPCHAKEHSKKKE